MADRDPHFRFRWERAIRSDSNLKATTRLVLFVLGTYMDNDGTNLRTSLSTVSRGAGISRRAAGEHIRIAVCEGWLEVLERGRKVGTGPNAYGKASEYLATLPATSEGDPHAPEGDPASHSEHETPESEGDPHAPEGDPHAPEEEGGSHHQPYTGSRPAAADAADREPSERDIAIRRLVRSFEERTGQVAGPGMRKRIAEQVDADLAADTKLDDTGRSLVAKIHAAETYGKRFALVLSRDDFMDDLAQQRDWTPFPDVVNAAVRAYDMHTKKVC